MIKKFRAWDIQQKRMSLPFNLGDSCLKWQDGDIDMSIEFGVSKNRLIIQQFTGLTDSQGVEIYEGDITLRRGKNKEVRFGEFWDGVDIGNGFFLQTSDRKLSYRNFGTNKISSFSESKVIGNIFENLKLLEKC